MKRISSRSKVRVVRLFTPPTKLTELDRLAPKRLTVRRLIHHRATEPLRFKYTFAQTQDGHMLSIANLQKLGFDFVG